MAFQLLSYLCATASLTMSTSYYQPELDPAEETVAVGDLFKVGGNNGMNCNLHI